MTILIVHCELNRSDAKSYKSRESILRKEITKGRRMDQVSPSGSIYFVHTPETAQIFMKRLVENCSMNRDKDRLAVVDVNLGKVYIWGIFDEEIRAKFPFLVEECGD